MHWTLRHQRDLLTMNAFKCRFGRTCLSVTHLTSRHQLDLLNIEASKSRDITQAWPFFYWESESCSAALRTPGVQQSSCACIIGG